ncbi:MAG TPA: low temperature requirement protein A [Pseudonocardiaceae bacterium]|nr:low temperature requirement protein A [Pseudonocardiaceae bacterium]
MSSASAQRPLPLVRPPALRTGQEASASRLELFFDLAYVLVVLELASTFVSDLTWRGLGTFVGLFIAIWFSWVGFTLYANRFDTDDVIFRIAKLAATLAIACCAASASAATSELSTPFALSFLAGRIVLLLLHARAWCHVTQARPTIAVYLSSTAVSTALWAVSLAVDGAPRYLLWAAAVAVDAAGPAVATWQEDRAPLHMEHLPERFGLFVILVLGEAVGGAAIGVHDAKWASASVAVGIAGFVIAGALWWNYFDITASHSADELQDHAEDHGNDDDATVDERHDLFVYGHLPLTAGIVIAGVGIKDLVLHPAATLPSAGGWTLAGGMALYLIGAAVILGGPHRAWRAVWPWPTAAIPVVLGAALVPHHTALLLVGGLGIASVALAILGTVRSRAR